MTKSKLTKNFEFPELDEHEDLDEYFLGKNPRKHKDYKHFGGKK